MHRKGNVAHDAFTQLFTAGDSKGQNQKAGLSIDATLAAQIDGLEISLDLDEDLAWGLSGRYSLGNAGLALYATYDASEAGGSIGSRLTF